MERKVISSFLLFSHIATQASYALHLFTILLLKGQPYNTPHCETWRTWIVSMLEAWKLFYVTTRLLPNGLL